MNEVPRYRKVLANDASANYLICRQVPVDADVEMLSYPALVRLHQETLAVFRAAAGDEEFFDNLIVEEPLFSLLDLKREILYHALHRCKLCLHHCEVDRVGTPAGICGLDARLRVSAASAEPEWLEEISPAFTVYFGGCNLRCFYCNTSDISFRPNTGEEMDAASLAMVLRDAYDEGARSVKFTGGEPSLHLLPIADILAHCEWNFPVVLHTNLYVSPSFIPIMEGLFDVVIADLKFGNNGCASEVAAAPRYWEAVTRNLESLACVDIVIRHIVLPGHIECCTMPLLEYFRDKAPTGGLQVLFNYAPSYAATDPALGLARTLTQKEMNAVRERLRAQFKMAEAG
jgi:putative pyruvate formate lyase activating enzyme